MQGKDVMSRYEISRREHEQGLAASHARGESEDRYYLEHPHDARLRIIRQIAESMKQHVIPVAKGQKCNELVF